MRKHPETGNPTRPRWWLVRAATTLAVWVVAFGVVTALLTLFRAELGSLPLALRALVLSGVLAALMANLVMPMLSVAAARWLASRAAAAPPGKGRSVRETRVQQPQSSGVGPGEAGHLPEAAAAPGAAPPEIRSRTRP